ncbi:MAG: Ig-like domain-containing protein [Myxococcales bacterium]
MKLDSTGNSLWGRAYGSSTVNRHMSPECMAVTPTGDVHIGGYQQDTLNALNKPGLTLTKIGSMDGFVLKVDTNSSTVWGTNFGGASAQTSFGECAIAVDGSGNVFFGSDFAYGNLTQPALTKIGTRDAFLVKLTVSDGTVSWSKNYGGASASMFNTGLTLDGSGNIYLGGSFQTADLTTPPITRFGAGDPYMLQLDASGTVSSTAHYGGQGATTSGKGIALDSTGNFVVAGTMAMANLTTPWLTRKGRTSSFVLREPIPVQSAPALAGIAAGWPTGTAVTVSATNNVDATAFWVALPAGDPAPTGAQIVAGQDASGNPVSLKSANPMTGGVPTAITVSGLSTSTSYRVYFATYNGTASSPLYVDVTTTSGEPPTTPILAGLTAGTPDATSVTLSSTSDVAATCHWIALPAGSSTPSAVQILQGQDASGTPVSLQGSASMPAGVPTSLSVSGLAATTNYRVYAVAYNGSLGTPLSVDVTTTSGGTPSVTTNAASNVTISGATLNASVSPNGVAVTGIGFEYGSTTAYGTSAAATPASLGAGAGTTGASYPVTGLSCGTTVHYRTVIAYGSSETAHGSDQSFATSACGPVLAGLTAGTPTATSVTLSSTSNLLGTGYWVALPTASSAPSGAQIAAGQDSTGASVLLNGSGAMTANVPASIAVTGLSSSTSYRIYFVASNGTVGSPLYVDVTSSAAPTPVLAGLTAGTPTGTSVTLSSTSNVTATGYWVALLTGSSTPSGAQIVAGQDSTGASVSLKGSGSMTANVPASIAVTGLSSSTSYRIYFVASNGTVGSPLYVDVTSAAAPTPVLAGLTAGTPAATSVTLSSTSNLTATGYWVALPTGSTAPSGAQIVAGQDSTGTPVSLNGSGSMTANAAASIAVTGLSSSTSYRIYFVASNGTVGSSLYVDVTTSGGQSQCAVDTECGSGNYCDGGQCYPIGEAASIQVTSGSGQTAVVGLPFSGALTVLVSDSGGHPVSGVTVQFTAPSSGASATLSTTTAVTDTSGVASDFALANTVAGTYSVVASIKAGTVQATITLTNRAGAANQVQPSVSSTTQRIPVGSSVPTPLVVTVRDANGNPVAGVEVTFTVSSTGPGATLGALKVLTDANGTATITATANTLTGSYVVYAQIAGVATPGRFELTNTAGPVAQLTVSAGSSNQSAQVGTAFTNRLGLTVVDAYGNGVSGLTVTFAAPSTGASAVLNPATPTTTNAAGVASVAATANGTVGDYVVTAAAQGLSTTFNLSNLLGSPGAITASASSTPQSATVGTAFTFPLLVTVVDSFGHPVSGALVIFAPPSGNVTAVLSALTTTTNGAGLASVSATASMYGGSYTTTASVAGVTAPARFALTNVPRPTTTSLDVTPTALKVGEVATATVTVLAVVGQPSGVVRLMEGTQELGQATLASGTATVSLTATQALLGTHTVFARYDGDGPNSPSESASVTVTVTEAASGDAGVDGAAQDSGGDAATVDAADSAVFDSGDAGAVDGSTVRDAAVDAAMADGSRVQDSASGTDAGSSDPGASGGGCQTGRGSARWPASLSLLLGFALLLRRRRHG